MIRNERISKKVRKETSKTAKGASIPDPTDVFGAGSDNMLEGVHEANLKETKGGGRNGRRAKNNDRS